MIGNRQIKQIDIVFNKITMGRPIQRLPYKTKLIQQNIIFLFCYSKFIIENKSRLKP